MDASEVALWVVPCPLTGMEQPCIPVLFSYFPQSPENCKTNHHTSPISAGLSFQSSCLSSQGGYLIIIWQLKNLKFKDFESHSLPHVHLQSQSSLPPPKNCFIGLYILGSKKKWLNTVIFSILMWALCEQKIRTGYERKESASEPRRPGRRRASLSNFCPPDFHV